MLLFMARDPLVSIGIDIIGMLNKETSGRRYVLVVTDKFMKVSQAVPLCRKDAYNVA